MAAMKKPFPALTGICSGSQWSLGWICPIPHLWLCTIVGIRFLGIWKLLSTANHLVILFLNGIPPSIGISPEVMVTLLSRMHKLKELFLLFWAKWTNTHWFAHTLSSSKYIEDLCSQIETSTQQLQILISCLSVSYYLTPIPCMGANACCWAMYPHTLSSFRFASTLVHSITIPLAFGRRALPDGIPMCVFLIIPVWYTDCLSSSKPPPCAYASHHSMPPGPVSLVFSDVELWQ
jgi:hypothetical protein